jgi:hypothetical protein
MELEPMNDALEAAIKSNATKSGTAERADDAMKYAQAALNLANALVTLKVNK